MISILSNILVQGNYETFAYYFAYTVILYFLIYYHLPQYIYYWHKF
uniref:Uncharacterized protein n=1 Tax=uncultured gamma proteobacterium EB750_07C09 TaxID=710974 RepID=E0Y3I8_9GAMM|nr:hypothetical protein [uncultured gamma proteobacterium EB750_07C09]